MTQQNFRIDHIPAILWGEQTGKILITCSRKIVASEKTILANGGIFENEIEVDGDIIRRFWITL